MTSRTAFAARDHGVSRAEPRAASPVLKASAGSRLVSRPAQGASAPSLSERAGFGTSRSGSISSREPMPPHSGQAPYGLLNENIRGETSGKEMPHSAQASCSEKRCGLPPSTASTVTTPSARRKRRLQRIGQAEPRFSRTTSRSTTTSIVCLLLLVQLDLVAELADRAVDADPRIPLALQIEEELLVLPLAPAHDGARTRSRVPGAWARTRSTICCTVCAEITRPHFGQCGTPDAREEHAQVVVDLGDGADGRARVLRGGLLLDRDRRRQPLDRVDLGLLHLLQELARVGRERLDVAALPLGVDGVEGERGLARAGEPGDHDELVARDLEVDVLEVVLARHRG